MRSLSSLGLALSLVFGFLLLALLGEIYYLLWWKKRAITRRDIEEDGYSSPAKEFLYLFCCKKPSSSLSSRVQNPQVCSSVRIRDTHVNEPQSLLHHAHSNKDLWVGGDDEDEVDESCETELLRLQNFSCPPRFLFTIKEETKEDLESEVGNKSRMGSRSRSLSDLSVLMETPFLTPLASSPYFTPPLSPLAMEFNPLFEPSNDAEFSRVKSSPPPIFKFLKDAEEKLQARELKEESKNKEVYEIECGKGFEDEESGSFITLILAKNKKRKRKSNQPHHHHHKPLCHSSSSQVLPLAFSPSTL